jgi:Ribbon-helix-helix protein, copG family
MRYICYMPTWQATAARLMEVPMPQTSFRFTKAEHAQLTELAQRLKTNQTEAIRYAIRDLLARVRLGHPVYLTMPPEGPEPPTSVPSAAPHKTLRVVENQAKRGDRPRPPRPSNTKRRKK